MTKKVIALFDVDGTLTVPRQQIVPEMEKFMEKLKENVTVGIVGGSDYKKITEQLGGAGGEPIEKKFPYVFSENGLVAFHNGEKIGETSMIERIGEEKYQDLTNEIFGLMANIRLPVKRGTFIEFRKGMINVSPIGRACSQTERDAFEQHDKTANVRPKMVEHLKEKFGDILTFSIGGQISFDVFPTGWDKTYSLRFLEEFDEIHFFGDKTYKGGNDYEIFESERTIGHTVTSWKDTMEQCTKLFLN